MKDNDIKKDVLSQILKMARGAMGSKVAGKKKPVAMEVSISTLEPKKPGEDEEESKHDLIRKLMQGK